MEGPTEWYGEKKGCGNANLLEDGENDSGAEGKKTEPIECAQEAISNCDLSIKLSPGLDGITGFSVRRQNMKRMGLVLESSSDSVPVAFKTFQKKAVLQEIAKRGKESDWNEHKAVIKAYPLEELLLVRDDGGSYGANYLMPFSELAYKAVLEAVEEARSTAVAAKKEAAIEKLREQEREAKKRMRDEEADVPLSPREWLSENAAVTAAEIEAMTIKPKRALITQKILRERKTMGATTFFESFTDRVHSLKAPKKSPCVDLKQELDFGLQAEDRKSVV